MAFQPNSPAARDAAFFMHPYTNARAHEKNGPMIIERGEGVYVYDDGGKQYLEAMAGLWSASLGFGENRLVKAATAAASHANHKPFVKAVSAPVLESGPSSASEEALAFATFLGAPDTASVVREQLSTQQNLWRVWPLTPCDPKAMASDAPPDQLLAWR